MSEIITRVKYDVRSDPGSRSIELRLVMTFPIENTEQNRKIQEILDHIENDGLISIIARPNVKFVEGPDEQWGNW